MESCDEQRIVEGLRNGDITSWHAFYDAFAGSVWRTVAIRLGGRTADIPDVVQETFLQAVRSIHSYNAARGRLEHWLGGVARYQVREWLRREQRHNRLTQVNGTCTAAEEARRRLSEFLQGRILDPVELLQQDETVVLVRKVLDRLTPNHAYILMAKYMDDLSIAEIAEEIELSQEAVRARLVRARRAFRRLFECHTERLEQSLENDNH